MKLFILGNGFDLAHAIESRYNDFREFLIEKQPSFLYEFESNYYFGTIELWRDFECNLSKIDEQLIFDNAMVAGDLGSDYDSGTDDGLSYYLDEQYSYINSLNIYVNQWAKSIDIDVNKVFRENLWNNNDIFITFNYTMVLENVYGITRNNILHIHGAVEGHSVEPVIGHGDYYLIEENRAEASKAENEFRPKEAAIYNAFCDYYEKTCKNVNKFMEYNKNFFKEKLNDVTEVYIIGHSMGQVDIPYFQKVKENINENSIWNIVWYSDSERERFIERLIEVGINRAQIREININECIS